MKGSLIVVGFFALGLLAGRSGCMPTWLMEGDISMVALCALLLFVGIGIGLNPDMKSELKSLSPRLAFLPLVTILGSWMGAVVSMLVAPPDEIGANGPNQRANSGVSRSVAISRMMLAKRAMVPSSAPRYSVMKMLDSE